MTFRYATPRPLTTYTPLSGRPRPCNLIRFLASEHTFAHWGDPRLKSSALQAQILKSLKSMPGHTFKAPDTNILKSEKSLRAADVGDGCLARTSKSTDIPCRIKRGRP